MTPHSLLLLSAASIVFYDALAAIGSRTMGFPYALASVGSVVLYVVIGAVAARLRSRQFGFIAGATTGIVDASGGWWVSWLIGPGRPSSGSINLTQWLVTAAVVATVACLLAGISGVLATWGRRPIRV
jgi:hypothetical protein